VLFEKKRRPFSGKISNIAAPMGDSKKFNNKIFLVPKNRRTRAVRPKFVPLRVRSERKRVIFFFF